MKKESTNSKNMQVGFFKNYLKVQVLICCCAPNRKDAYVLVSDLVFLHICFFRSAVYGWVHVN